MGTTTTLSTELEFKKLVEKNNLTKEYLRRALLKLKKSTELLDVEEDESDEFEESVTKFIAEVKRKNLL
jgi:hypothetical protein